MWQHLLMEEVFILNKESILSAAYWKAAVGELKQLKKLAIAALICALCVVVDGFLTLPLGQTLQVKFAFIPMAVGVAVYGPVMGAVVAALTDTLSFFLFNGGWAYFPGYMLSEVLAAMIFGLFLYRKKITVWRLFGARTLVNFPINVALGALWSYILYDAAYIADLWLRLVKNALLLPLEVILLAALFALLIPVCARMRLLPAHGAEELQRLSVGASTFPVLALSCLIGGGCSIYYALRAEQPWIFGLLGGLLLAGAAALPIIGALMKKKNAEG